MNYAAEGNTQFQAGFTFDSFSLSLSLTYLDLNLKCVLFKVFKMHLKWSNRQWIIQPSGLICAVVQTLADSRSTKSHLFRDLHISFFSGLINKYLSICTVTYHM